MSKFFKKYNEIFLLLFLAIVVFYITYNPNYQSDAYLDIKAGQVFTQQGIIFHDVFSNSAYGRKWYPFQWLFQVGIYYLQHFFGMPSIAIFVSLFSVIIVLVLYYYLNKLFRLPAYLLVVCSLFYAFGDAIYLVSRATIVAALFFVASALIVLLYVLKNKNVLWLLIPIGILWVNVHASFVILILILGSYAGLSLLLYWIEKEKLWLRKAKILGVYTLGIFLLAFTPPLYGAQYQVLLLFWQERQMVQKLVEWMPLILHTDMTQFVGYTATLVIIVLSGLFIRKQITRKDLILAIPLVFLAFSPFVTFRNIVYGWLAIVIFIAFTLEKLEHFEARKVLIGIYIVTIGFALAYYSQLNSVIYDKAYHPIYPDKASSFILKYHLKGNMYNNYVFGDYLLYRLYPQQRVFVDARADVYACCEYHDVADLIMPNITSNQQMTQFAILFLSSLNKYHISFVVSTDDSYSLNHNYILQHDPAWSLVYWDDFAQIFVRRNGLNDNIIKQFGAVAARPYDASFYDPKNVKQAIYEYNRMIAISDSVVSRDNLAVLYIDHKDYADATTELQRAVQMVRTNPKAYVELGYIAIQQQNLPQAFQYYKKAIQYNSDNPLPYISVGELYMKLYGDSNSAKDVWQQGLDKVSDQAGRERLTQLLNSN